jgi:hypothetical protein
LAAAARSQLAPGAEQGRRELRGPLRAGTSSSCWIAWSWTRCCLWALAAAAAPPVDHKLVALLHNTSMLLHSIPGLRMSHVLCHMVKKGNP